MIPNNNDQTVGRIEFDNGYAPTLHELAFEKQSNIIKSLEWEIELYRKFIGEILTSGKLVDINLIKEADKVMKCPTIKRTYEGG
jgi:hypothetical protein